MLKEIKSKIDELSAESEIFKEHQESEDQANCIEYIIYQKNIDRLMVLLEELNEELREKERNL